MQMQNSLILILLIVICILPLFQKKVEQFSGFDLLKNDQKVESNLSSGDIKIFTEIKKIKPDETKYLTVGQIIEMRKMAEQKKNY